MEPLQYEHKTSARISVENRGVEVGIIALNILNNQWEFWPSARKPNWTSEELEEVSQTMALLERP